MKGLALVIGDIGTGKTTLATRFLEELETGEYEAALLIVLHAAVTSEWMYGRLPCKWKSQPPPKAKPIY